MECAEMESNNNESSLEETIQLLTDQENCDACDNSCERFKNSGVLPDFYDEEKFKLGQQFYRKNLFGMMLSKFMGLLAVISTPSITKILIFTQKSSDNVSSYKRYLATIYHMRIWYDNEFKPNSKLWNSISAVKLLHNSASNRSCSAGSIRILQKDMGITQFGFMGFALVRPELVGIHHYTREEQEGFVHLWRVVGYLLGIKDSYNICRSSLEETKQLCEALIEKVFVPNMRTHNPEYLVLAEALINGMWVMMPMLETKSITMYTYTLLNQNLNNNQAKLPVLKPNIRQAYILFLLKIYVYNLKFTIFRWYANFLQVLSIWLITYLPFLAFYAYGFKNSYVRIHVNANRKKIQ